MSGDNGSYKKPQLMRELSVELWSNKPLDTTEHEMTNLFDEDVRVAAAIYRCSYCYPHQRKYAIKPRLKHGTFEDWVRLLHERMAKCHTLTREEIEQETATLDDDGNPVFLTNKDLCLILGLKHQNVSRGVEVARAKGVVAEGFPFYYEAKPAVVPHDDSRISTDAKPRLLTVGSLCIRISTDADPADVKWAENLRTRYNTELSRLRAEVRTAFQEGGTRAGIYLFTKTSIKNEEKRGKTPPRQSRPPDDDGSPPAPETPPQATNGSAPPVPEEVLANSESDAVYSALRQVFDHCGRRVTIEAEPETRAEFDRHPLAMQRRILEDACARADNTGPGTFDQVGFTPTLLRYLRDRKWLKEPMTKRAAPPPPARPPTPAQARQDERREALRINRERLMREAAMEASGGGGSQ